MPSSAGAVHSGMVTGNLVRVMVLLGGCPLRVDASDTLTESLSESLGVEGLVSVSGGSIL